MLPTFICRFFCAKRVQKENQLDFYGERGIWDGQVLNREIRGKSLLYIYCEVWIINQSDIRKRLKTLICFIFHALGWLISSWPQIPYVAVWDWRNNPYSQPPLSVCFRFRHWKVLFCEALWNKIKVIRNRFKKTNKVL